MIMGNALGRQGPYTDIEDPVLSSDGAKAGFVYYIGTPASGQKYYVSTPEQTYGPFQWAKGLCCTPSGDRFGFLYSESDKIYFRIGASRYGPVDEVSDLRYVPGAGFSCRYRLPKGWLEFLEGKSWGPYYSLYDLAATADGKIVYKVEMEDPYFAQFKEGSQGVAYVVADHRMYGPYKSLSWVSMTKDNKNYAYAYEDGQGWHLRSHSRTLGPFTDDAWTNTFTVSNAGSFAYVLKESDGGKALYIDGKRQDVAGDLSWIMFSADGTGCAVKVGK